MRRNRRDMLRRGHKPRYASATVVMVQARGLSYVAAVLVGAILLAGCSREPTVSVDAYDLCDFVDEISGGLVLSDDLLSRSATSRTLQNRMTEASRMLDGLGELVDEDALRDDADLVKSAVDEARIALATADFEPYVLLASNTQEGRDALTHLGSAEVTDARIHLVEEFNTSCEVSLDEPTSELGVIVLPEAEGDPIRRTEIVVANLSTVELTALLSSGIGIEAETELLSVTGYENIATLLDAIRTGAIELDGRERRIITTAIQRGDYGDDESLDNLWDACAGWDYSACDLLWYTSPRNTAYERYGASCGDRLPAIYVRNRCVNELKAQ